MNRSNLSKKHLRRDIRIAHRWCSEMGVTYQPEVGTYRWHGISYTPYKMGAFCWRDIMNRKFPRAAAELAFERLAFELREKFIAATKASLPLSGDASDMYLRAFVAFITGAESASDLDVIAFKQFLWQIKRKLHGKSTEWEIMPLFTGGQGFGKTRHLRRLFTPLHAFVAKGVRLNIFNDEFGRAMFHRCYIVPFEEMANAKSVDIETLKLFITEREITARIMRSEEFATLRMNATFYGTSNLPANASLHDDTGMRRFWEFKCPNREYTEADGAILESINYAAVWGAVDATSDESPVRAHRAAFGQAQAVQFKDTGPLATFFEEEVIRTSADERLTQDELYTAVREWFTEQGIKPPLKRIVREFAVKLGFTVYKTGNRPVIVGAILRPRA